MAERVFHRSRPFSLLWGGQLVGNCGSALGGVALPLAVVTILNATPAQAGALRAVEFGAVPAFALIAGAIADRFDRRRLLLSSSILRTLMMALVPFALAFQGFGFGLVFAVAVVIGFATAVYDTVVAALLPVFFPERVEEVNERLAMGGSMAEMFGTGLAGAIVQLIGPRLSIFGNAVALFCASLTLCGLHHPDQVRVARRPERFGLTEGIKVVFAHRLLRRIVLANATSHFGGAMGQAVVFIFFFRELHLSALSLGVVFAVANLGVLGAGASRYLVERVGVRTTCALALLGRGLGNLCIPCAAFSAPIPFVAASRLILTFCGPLFEVQQQNVAMAASDVEILGRATSAVRLVVWGALPFGSLAGGIAAGRCGIVPVLIAAGVVSGLSSIWMLVPSLCGLWVRRPGTAGRSAGARCRESRITA